MESAGQSVNQCIGRQGAFAFLKAAQAQKPERLVFALMLAEDDALTLARFADRLLAERELSGQRIKPARLHIPLYRLGRCTPAALYAAKLAGQAVAAAGLKLSFDAIGSVGRDLTLQSRDTALATLQEKLGAALAKLGLSATRLAPHLPLAMALARQPAQVIEPFTLTVTGLALLRAASKIDYDVLRRWPLNKLR